MSRNIAVEGLVSRIRDDGETGSVMTAKVGDGCVSADMVEGAGTVRVSRDQTIVRVRFGENNGVKEVAVNDKPVWSD
jgi:hypothetical protein